VIQASREYLRSQEEERHGVSPEIHEQLNIARMWMEKCEFSEARRIHVGLLEIASYKEDPVTAMEALAGLIRLAGEASDSQQAERWEHELERWMERHPRFTPPRVWYCRGALARSQNQPMKAQRFFLRYLREVRRSGGGVAGPAESREELVRAWLLLATALLQRGRRGRAAALGRVVLSELEKKPIRSLNGNVLILLGYVEEVEGRLDSAMDFYRRAHSILLAEHNWFYHLSVLYAYARIARCRGQHSQAEFYLDLVAGACTSPELATLRSSVEKERAKLDLEQIDLLVHPRRGEAVFRGRKIEFQRQFVLMDLLEALCEAHAREGADEDRGLSKKDLVEKVWSVKYRPEVHDNKLYYNINRLRRLIEVDCKDPQILLSWREGYRLALSLRIRVVRESEKSIAAGVARAATLS